jgi:hexosaminidase
MDGPAEAETAFRAAADCAARLFSACNPPLFSAAGGIACVARNAPGTGQEGYRIEFAANAVRVHASSAAGFFYGFVTLGHILRAGRLDPAQFTFPFTGEIVDSPRFGWRGMLLDVARQVFCSADLLWLLDCLAWHKLNRLHLHLSDDEGWRLDIPGYPQLAELAAWRGHGLAIPPLLGSSAEPYGIVYSRADIQELTDRAEELMITLVPEIEMPAHSYSVLQALPALRDPADCGIHRNILNPAVLETYQYVEAVIAELCHLFPSRWIHVGADEVPGDAWLGSPLAKRLMQELDLQHVYDLQSHFLQRVQRIVRAQGRCTAAWEEAALGNGIDPGDCYLIAWRNPANALALAKQGYDVVLSPGEAYYLDMARADDWWEPGMDWAGYVPVKRCYAYDPGGEWPVELKIRLIGVQACLWSEHLHDRKIFARLTIPRLAAVAESAWTAPVGKNFRRFSAMYDLLPPSRIR